MNDERLKATAEVAGDALDCLDRRQLLIRGGGAIGLAGLGPVLAACGGTLAKNSTGGESTKSGGGSGGGGKTIAFSYLYSEVPGAAPLKNFARERARQFGYTLLTDNITAGNIEQQLSSLQDFITRKVDALVVHVTNPSSYGGILAQAKQAGIPFFTYATAVKGSSGGILFPFYPAAQQLAADAAGWVNHNVGGQGQILILSYTADPLGRQASIELGKGVANQTHAHVVAMQDALDQTTALSVTQDALKAHPDINVVMAWNDDGALGAAQAMKDAGKDPNKVYIGSDEGTSVGIQAMLQGNKYIKTLDLISVKKLGDAVVDLPRRYFLRKATGNLVVNSTIVHSNQTALLRQSLSDY